MTACPACGFEYEGSFKFCPDCASPLPAAASFRESRKIVTALFCDLVGSTALGEQHDPEVLSPMFERYFTEMRSAVERQGGRVEKFIGDAVAAVFGLPSAHEDDALRGIRAGFEMQASLEALNEASPFPLAARVGVSTGEVLVSGDGNTIGDVMNTAARLQTAASPGSVLIGEPTWRLVRDAIVAEAVEPLDAKGKAEPVPAWRVVQVEAGPRRQSTTPFVGRGRLIALLGVAFEQAVADEAPVLATVLGDPGIGKSRLLDAFLRDLPGTTILRTTVPAEGEGSSLAPVADLVRTAVDADGSDDVADKLASLVGDGPDARALEAALRSLLGLGGQSPAESTWAIRRLLETLAARKPVVVLLDDLHWASPMLSDLVEDAARWTRGPVLLLCAARLDLLDARQSWGGGMQRAITITVGPLEIDESRELGRRPRRVPASSRRIASLRRLRATPCSWSNSRWQRVSSETSGTPRRPQPRSERCSRRGSTDVRPTSRAHSSSRRCRARASVWICSRPSPPKRLTSATYSGRPIVRTSRGKSSRTLARSRTRSSERLRTTDFRKPRGRICTPGSLICSPKSRRSWRPSISSRRRRSEPSWAIRTSSSSGVPASCWRDPGPAPSHALIS